MQTKKVIIVGAGPAGLATAIELGKTREFEVVVLEKNKGIGYKVCAGGIDYSFIKTHLSEKIIERKFNNFKFITPKQSVEIKENDCILTTVNRKTLHDFLTKKAVDSGAKILFGRQFKEINNNSILTSSNEKFQFDYLVGADGSNSMARKALKIGTKKIIAAFQYLVRGNYPDLEFHIDFDKFGFSYAWIFPQNDIVSVGAGYYPRDSEIFSMQDLRNNLSSWAKNKFDLSKGRFEAFSINYDYRGFEFGNIFLAGDAAGLASGLTGEGIKFAILSGIDIAKKIIDPSYDCMEIKNTLRIKNQGESLRNFLKLNKAGGKIAIEMLAFSLKTKLGRSIFPKVS